VSDRAKHLRVVPDDSFDVAVDMLTREQRRARRQREVRAVTLSAKNSKRRVAAEGALYPEDVDADRPRTRGDCEAVARPCPYVGCRHHLYLDVLDTGNLKLNFPDLEPEELTESCSLDVADHGGARLEDVGALMNVTRERIRQLQDQAQDKLEKRGKLDDWKGHVSAPGKDEP
jgi:hypothetical protein